jgi:hypothetical protein
MKPRLTVSVVVHAAIALAYLGYMTAECGIVQGGIIAAVVIAAVASLAWLRRRGGI